MATSSIDGGRHGGVSSEQSGAGATREDASRGWPRVPVAFLGDALWWAAGLLGLLTDVTLRLLAPGVLAGSALLGAGQWLSCVLLQPVVEEVVFRGVLQGELRRRSWGGSRICRVTAANGVCSIAFTALHFIHHPPLWAASVLAPSLIFGWLRERHGTVAAPIVMHVLYNLEFFSAASLVMR